MAWSLIAWPEYWRRIPFPFGCPPTLVPETFSEAWWSDIAQSWVLPVIAMAALPLAQIARHTKASVLEILHSDYVRTAHSKGLREDRIVRVHLLRNAAIPAAFSSK